MIAAPIPVLVLVPRVVEEDPEVGLAVAPLACEALDVAAVVEALPLVEVFGVVEASPVVEEAAAVVEAAAVFGVMRTGFPV